MSWPKWKLLTSADTWRILIDETGEYPAELEIADEVYDAKPSARFLVFRLPLDRYKEIREDNEIYLVPVGYAATWSRPASAYEAWFVKDLPDIARSNGTTEEEIRKQLCSDDPLMLANAYQSIAGYWGWDNFDQYPLRLSEDELNERWNE